MENVPHCWGHRITPVSVPAPNVSRDFCCVYVLAWDNTTPQILAPRYSDSFSPSHTNTAPVQSKWETPFIKCAQGLGRVAGGECSQCPQKGRGALGKVETDFNQDKQKDLGSCPMSGKRGIKEQGFQWTVKCRQPPLPNFPCLPPYTGWYFWTWTRCTVILSDQFAGLNEPLGFFTEKTKGIHSNWASRTESGGEGQKGLLGSRGTK